MNSAIAVFLLCGILPVKPEPARCDQIELNCVYNDEGCLWLRQVIFWRWEPRVGWVAEGWRRADQGELRPTARGWRWEEPGRRSIEAPQFRRSWTQYDRELVNRDDWPVTRRRLSPIQ